MNMQSKKGEVCNSEYNLFPRNNCGQGLSTNAIILIILGVIILAVLILGFTLGWNTLLPFLPSNNVDTIVNQCSAACATNSKFDYCSNTRSLDDGQLKVETNCATFSVISEYDKYGIAECPTIDCDFECTDIMGSGIVKDACDETENDVTSITSVSGTQRCCVAKIVP